MTDVHAAVAGFLKEFSGAAKPLPDDADIFDSLGIDGDDASEFIERFAAKFEIDATFRSRWDIWFNRTFSLAIIALLVAVLWRRVHR